MVKLLKPASYVLSYRNKKSVLTALKPCYYVIFRRSIWTPTKQKLKGIIVCPRRI